MVADDIDSMLNEEERNIEVEELKEERERAKKRQKPPPSRSAPFGIDEDIELTHDVPGELERIDHHAEERRAIEETITPNFLSSEKPVTVTVTVKKKNSGKQQQQGKSQVTKGKGAAGNSTKKQKERYSKE